MRISDWSSDVCSSDLDGPILIHGGGNMGTLWPKHEAFRLHLLRTHRGHPVVQLPQSIHYADPAAAAEMAEAIRNHGQFTLLVRDARSLAFAERPFDCALRPFPAAALMPRPPPPPPATVPVFPP